MCYLYEYVQYAASKSVQMLGDCTEYIYLSAFFAPHSRRRIPVGNDGLWNYLLWFLSVFDIAQHFNFTRNRQFFNLQ